MAGVELTGSRVLLTGASSGIGRELAKELVARGAVVAVTARRRALLEQIGAAVVIDADLSQRGAAHALAAEARDALGGIDVLINNAGGGVGGAIWAVGDGDPGREAFETNYWSPMALIQELVPGMRERGRGAVVNVTSLARVSTWPLFGGYAATKGAFSVATETLRLELMESGVHVMEVLLGPIDTAVQGETRLAPGIERMIDRIPLGDAATTARLVARALERGRQRVIYPRRTAIAYYAPALVTWDTRRLVAKVPRAEREALGSLVVRTGSMGDDIARQAREEWERVNEERRSRPAR
jgi:short-subunit dehydrogenase